MMGPKIGSPPNPKLTPLLSPSSSTSSSSSSSHRPTAGDAPILEPPSYADAIFRPADPPAAGNPSTSHYLEITVTDPRKDNDDAFVTFLITTRARGAPSPFAVRRRFRQVVALADRLAQSHRGLFLPVRPEKSVAGGPAFLEERRAALERYLRRVARHPVIGRGDEIGDFLGAGDFGDGAAARGGRELVRMVTEFGQSVGIGWGGTRGDAAEEDGEFSERRGWVKGFGDRLHDASEPVIFMSN